MNLNQLHNQENNQEHNTSEIPEKIQQLFTSAHSIHLTNEEKLQGKNTFQNLILSNQKPTQKRNAIGLIISPYTKNLVSKSFTYVKNKKIAPAIAVLLIVIMGVTTTAYAAQDTLPGDFLYPVKIHINENIESVLAVKTETKAKVAVKHAITRAKEIETLLEKDSIDDKTEASLNEGLTKKSEEAQKSIDDLKINGDVKAAIDINFEFSKSLNQLETKLDSFSKSRQDAKKDNQNAQKTLNAFTKKIREHITTTEKQRLEYLGSIATSSLNSGSSTLPNPSSIPKDISHSKNKKWDPEKNEDSTSTRNTWAPENIRP